MIPAILQKSVQVTAVLLLASTLAGLLAPAAVAMSRDDIVVAHASEDLASDAKDFFSDVLEDALFRSTVVAQVWSNAPNRIAPGGRVLFVLAGSADHDFETCGKQAPVSRLEFDQSVLMCSLGFGGSGEQSLGP